MINYYMVLEKNRSIIYETTLFKFF